MCKEFLGDVNLKSLTFAIIAVFVFIFLSDWVIHGKLLAGMYEESADLWRSKEAMKDFFLYMLLGQLIIADTFTFLYARGCEGKSWCEGLRFGITMGFLFSGGTLIWYAVAPYSSALLWSWIGGNFFQAMGAGTIAGLIYKK